MADTTNTDLVVPEGYDWITQEYADLGLTPTQADVDNWVKYGQPGQITAELGGGMTTVQAGSTPINVYTKLPEQKDFKFDYSNKEGQVFAVPEGTAVAGGNNYKLVGTKDIDGVSYDIYANEGEQGSGLSGLIEDATGIDLNKIVPNEVKSGIVPIPGISDPFGVTQGIVFGAEGAEEGLGVLSDITGLQPEEIQMAQDLGWTAASIAAGAATGNPYVTAGMMSLKQTSDTTKTDEDWADLSKSVALNFAIAGAVDLASSYLTTPKPETPATDPMLQQTVGDSSGVFSDSAYSQFGAADVNGVPVYPISGNGTTVPPGEYNPLYNSTVDYGAAASATAPTVDAVANAQAGYYNAAAANQTAQAAAAGKSIWSSPQFYLSLAGLGLGAYGIYSQQQLIKQQQGQSLEDQMALIDYQSQKNMEYLQAQQAFAAEQAAADRAPVPSKAPPSMYTKRYGVY